MAKQTVNIGSTANDGTGDQLRTAFDKLNQNNDEIYGNNFVTEGMLNDNIVGTDELKVADYGVAGQILTSDGDGTFSWATGVTGDITGVDAGDGLTGGGTGGDVTLTVGAGTGITVAADAVSLAASVQTEISENTIKTGITSTQAGHITDNNDKISFPGFGTAAGTALEGNTDLLEVGPLVTDALAGNTTTITTAQVNEIAANTLKDTDQTVVLTEGANVTITGTYPSFTIASDDVVGAVTSVNGETEVVVLDTDNVNQGSSNLYYTDAKVVANSAVALNTAKTGITDAQAADIVDNNGKTSNVTHTGAVTGNEALTITDLAVTTGKIADEAVDATKLDVTNNGAAGQVLQYNADGTMTWVTGVTGDITAVTAGAGLTGGGTGGDVTLTVVGGDGITASADEISLSTSVAGDGLTLSSGVLSVDTIETGDIADDAVTSAKLDKFDDNLAATDTHILVANGTDFFNKAMSGDATLANTGAITIADDAVTADKLADSINTDIATGVAKVSNVTTNLSITGTTDARTIVSSDGTTTAVIPVATTSVSGVMSKTIFDEHVENNAKAANAVHTGEVEGGGALVIKDGAVIAARLATDAVTTAKIANDAVSHDKLENRFTQKVSVTNRSGATPIDWSAGAVFVMANSLNGNIEFDFTNFKTGQTIDIYNLTGPHTITFDSDASTSETFNKCGGVDYAGASTNLIQVQCVDDSAAAVFNYAVSAYVSDTTPS